MDGYVELARRRGTLHNIGRGRQCRDAGARPQQKSICLVQPKNQSSNFHSPCRNAHTDAAMQWRIIERFKFMRLREFSDGIRYAFMSVCKIDGHEPGPEPARETKPALSDPRFRKTAI